jgi:glycosyltransferase involved in cell wall biosynthesis
MKKCIGSILSAGDRVEVIIINDGSTDHTGEIADDFARRFPRIVKVIHQINGGHGEGINQGVRYASGKYFKVVDSDDWVEENKLKAVLDRLEYLEKEGGIDLLVTNYVYEYEGKRSNRTIRYKNVFPLNRIVEWKETKPFFAHQFLTIHSVIYKTELLRKCNIELPKHVSYEDNLFVYYPLPLTKTLLYMDLDLYHYKIGREDQSVSEHTLKRRYMHQILIAKLIFSSHDLKVLRDKYPKLGKYMYHEAKMMLIMATAFARLNKSYEAEEQVKQLWEEVVNHSPDIGRKICYHSEAVFINRPGRFGRIACVMLYRLAHKVIRFN